MNIKPLIAYWRPKDIPEVLQALQEIPCDKIYCNYMPYPYNYTISRDFFLSNPEYTHYVALPNDLIPTKEIFRELIDHIKQQDYPIISGVCNVDTKKYKDKINITANLPMLNYNDRRYYWISKNRYPNRLVKVPWAGFPFMFIRRDIVEKIPFAKVPFETHERPVWEEKGGFGGDLAFAWSCHYYKIPIMVDTSLMMRHLRFHGENLVGKKPPSIEVVLESLNITPQILAQID